MMNYLKFISVFLFELIKGNIVKISFLIIAVLSFIYAGTFEQDIKMHNVVSLTNHNNNYIYLCSTERNGEISYDVVESEKLIPIKDGIISTKSYAEANVLLWALFVISFMIPLIGTFIEDGWEVEDHWLEAFSTLIHCEEENGEFYYIALGRLIEKTNKQVSRGYRITNQLNISGFRQLYRCPKFQTKSKRRESILNKIGIN